MPTSSLVSLTVNSIIIARHIVGNRCVLDGDFAPVIRDLPDNAAHVDKTWRLSGRHPAQP
jgi:hypothetical protein